MLIHAQHLPDLSSNKAYASNERNVEQPNGSLRILVLRSATRTSRLAATPSDY
jgi:hypothetical protein